jgi:voltage-gated potassium channel
MAVDSSLPLKERVYFLLDGSHRESWISFGTNLFIMTLIVLNVATYIAGTVSWIGAQYGQLFNDFDVFCVGVFTVEYVLRVWSCTVDERYSSPIRGRLRFMVSPHPF